MLVRIVEIVIDSQTHREIRVLGGRRDQDLPGTGFNVFPGPGTIDKETRRLKNHLRSQIRPRQGSGVTFGRSIDPVAVDSDRLVIVAHLGIKNALAGVVLEEMDKSLVVGQVIDRHDLIQFSFLRQTTKDHPADPAEPIDCILRHSGGGIVA